MRACLANCRSPLDFVINRWHDGWTGALRMGSAHGAYCLGCCAVLMALLFVGGVMNLLWVATIAAFAFIEKLFPAGQWIARAWRPDDRTRRLSTGVGRRRLARSGDLVRRRAASIGERQGA